jgi:hypothetical protein
MRAIAKSMLFSAVLLLASTGVARASTPICAVLYDDANLQGMSLIAWGTDTRAETVPAYFNDKMSSAYVSPNCTLIAYEDANFRGPYLILSETAYLVPDWFNDTMSSFTCICSQ